MNKQLLTYILAVFISFTSYSQQDNTLFFMHELPQANFVNPAVQSNCKLFIGFPALSSIHINYSNTAFTFNDAFTTSNKTDSLYLNLDNIISKMSGTEIISTDVDLTLFTAGIFIKNYYVTLSINEKGKLYNTIPSDMLKLGWYGNTSFIDKKASLSGLRINANNYHEIALGVAKTIDSKWQLGFKTKILFGLGNIYTRKTNGSIYTDNKFFAIDLALNSNINSSLPIDITTDNTGNITDVQLKNDFSVQSYLLNFNNYGVAFDFGFIYKINKNATLSGSLLDLGTIFWNNDLNNFFIDGNMLYEGPVEGSNFQDPNYFDRFTDSLEAIFMPELKSITFSNPLVPKAYIGLTYNLNKYINAGVLYRSDLYRNTIHPSVTLSLNTLNLKFISFSTSYTLQNSEYSNFGAGMGVKIGPIQLHIISDNIVGYFNLADTRNVNLRFGLSIITGCNNKKDVVYKGKYKRNKAAECVFNPYKKHHNKKTYHK